MTKKIIWRLKESPSTEKLLELVKGGILNKEEAREILFSSLEEGERDSDSLKSEIKFLRELIEKLSSDKSRIIEIIREVPKYYNNYTWYPIYGRWCSSSGSDSSSLTYNATIGSINYTPANITQNFSEIKTF